MATETVEPKTVRKPLRFRRLSERPLETDNDKAVMRAALTAAQRKFNNPKLTADQIGFYEGDDGSINNFEDLSKEWQQMGKTFLRQAALSQLPNVAGGIAGTAATLGTGMTGAGAPVVGALVGAGTGLATSLAQDALIEKLANSQLPGADIATDIAQGTSKDRALNPKTAMVASALGGWTLAHPFVRGGVQGLRKLLAEQTGRKVEEVTSKEVANILGKQAAIGAGVGGGLQAAQDPGGEGVVGRVAEAALLGAAGGATGIKPTAVGRWVNARGGDLGEAIAKQNLSPERLAEVQALRKATVLDQPEQPMPEPSLTNVPQDVLLDLLNVYGNTPDAQLAPLRAKLDELNVLVPDLSTEAGKQLLNQAARREYGRRSQATSTGKGEEAAKWFDAKAKGIDVAKLAPPRIQEINAVDQKLPGLLTAQDWQQMAIRSPQEVLSEILPRVAADKRAQVELIQEQLKLAADKRAAAASEDLQLGLADELRKVQEAEAKGLWQEQRLTGKEISQDITADTAAEKAAATAEQQRLQQLFDTRLARIQQLRQRAAGNQEAQQAVAEELAKLQQEFEAMRRMPEVDPRDTGAIMPADAPNKRGVPASLMRTGQGSMRATEDVLMDLKARGLEPGVKGVWHEVTPQEPQQPAPGTEPGIAYSTILPPRTVGELVGKVRSIIGAGGPEPERTPTPEGPLRIQQQLLLTQDPKSEKAVTLVTPGDPVPAVPAGLRTTTTPHGVAVYNPDKVSLDIVTSAGEQPIFPARLLGLGAEVPASDLSVQTSVGGVRGVLSELATPETVATAVVQQQRASGGRGVTEVLPAEEAIQQRVADADAIYGGIPPQVMRRLPTAAMGAINAVSFRPLNKLTQPTLDRIEAIEPGGRGTKFREHALAMRTAFRKWLNQDVMSYAEAVKGLNKEQMQNVDGYLSDMQYDGMSLRKLSDKEQDAVNLIRGTYMAQVQRYKQQDARLVNGNRFIEIDPNALPNSPTKDIIRVLREGSENHTDTKLRNEFLQRRNEFVAHYREKSGASTEDALKAFDDYRGNFLPSSLLSPTAYGAMRKAEGFGLPRGWNDTLMTRLTRHATRSALDLAFWKYFQNDPELSKWIGIPDNGVGEKYTPAPGEPAGDNPAIRAWLQEVSAYKSFHSHPMLDAIGLLGTGTLGFMSGLKDLTLTPFLLMSEIQAPKQLLALAKSAMSMFGEKARGAGAASAHNSVMVEKIGNGLLESGVTRARDLATIYSGRAYMDRISRELAFTFGREMVFAKAGDLDFADWIKSLRLAKGWEDALQNMRVDEIADLVGDRMVDLSQGNYDSSTLPPWLLRTQDNGVALFLGGLARWSVGRFNGFYERVWQPAVKNGNLQPLINALFAGLLGAEAKEKIGKELTNTLPNYWRPSELAKVLDKELAYSVFANLNAAGTMGIAGSLLTAALSKDLSQVPVVNLGMEAAEKVQLRVQHLLAAFQEGADTPELVAEALKDTSIAVLEDTFQTIRMFTKAANPDERMSREERIWRRQTGRMTPDNGGLRLANKVSPLGKLQQAETQEEVAALYPQVVGALENPDVSVPSVRSAVRDMGPRKPGEHVGFYDWLKRNNFPADEIATVQRGDMQRQMFQEGVIKPTLEQAYQQALPTREARAKKLVQEAGMQVGP